MLKKYKIAFIYEKSNVYLSGKHYDNVYYHFFMNALKRNQLLDVTYFPTEKTFDAMQLKNKFDVILLWENNTYGMPEEIFGIDDLDIPVIAKASDPSQAKYSIPFHKKWKIDYYFHFIHKDYFYELYPSNFKYETIFFGLESRLYKNLTPFEKRIKNRILNSGNTGNTKFLSKLILKIKNPRWNALNQYYLRTLCTNLPYVDYTSTLQHEYINDRYPLLLQKYSAAIAACTFNPSAKFWEIPAAGCLTFMEITKKNKGDFLGFVDNESAIFINEKNYKQKFEEYLTNSDNPKWRKIAANGKKFALENFNNDKAVHSLVALIKNLI
jgi:hypothetical protein